MIRMVCVVFVLVIMGCGVKSPEREAQIREGREAWIQAQVHQFLPPSGAVVEIIGEGWYIVEIPVSNKRRQYLLNWPYGHVKPLVFSEASQ